MARGSSRRGQCPIFADLRPARLLLSLKTEQRRLAWRSLISMKPHSTSHNLQVKCNSVVSALPPVASIKKIRNVHIMILFTETSRTYTMATQLLQVEAPSKLIIVASSQGLSSGINVATRGYSQIPMSRVSHRIVPMFRPLIALPAPINKSWAAIFLCLTHSTMH